MCTITLNSNPSQIDIILLYESSKDFTDFFSEVHSMYKTFQNPSEELLGKNLYSQVIKSLDRYLIEMTPNDDLERKKQGRFYTSKSVCRFINRRVYKHYNNSNTSFPVILDPSSGIGYFLFDMLFLIIQDILRKGDPISAESLLSHFLGCEIHKESIELCKKLLIAIIGMLLITGILSGNIKKVVRVIDQHINETDFLSVEFKIKPDIIVGNPPYIRVHKLSPKNREFLRESYFTAIYDFDIYVCFFEKSLSLLSQNGILGFITPEKYLLRKYAKNLRLLLLLNTLLIEIIDVSRCINIFKEDTYPIITVLRKITNELQYKESLPIKHSNTDKISLIRTNLFNAEIQQTILGILNGIFSQSDEGIRFREYDIEIYKKFVEDPEYRFIFHLDPIMEQLESIFQGLSKIGDTNSSIFCGTPRSKFYHEIKHNLTDSPTPNCRKFIISRNISPFRVWWDFPITFDHDRFLRPYYNLDNGVFSKNIIQKFSIIPKILIKANSRNITATIDNTGYVFVGIYGLIWRTQNKINTQILNAIINSSLINYYILRKYKSYMLNSQFLSINSSIIKEIPLPGVLDEHGAFHSILAENQFNEILDILNHLLSKLNNQINALQSRHSNEIIKDKLIQIQKPCESFTTYKSLDNLDPLVNEINEKIMDLYAIPEFVRLKINEYYGLKYCT